MVSPLPTLSGARASALQPKPLELFPSGAPPDASGDRRRPTSARRSLCDRKPGASELSTAHSNGASTAGAAELLASLRAKTLLDYGFMREFSLAKRKPVAERSLSRLSAQSVYRMRRTQMELDQQSRRLQAVQLQFHPPPLASETASGTVDSSAGAKAEGESRSATATSTAATAPLAQPATTSGRRRVLSLRRVSACTSRAYPSARASIDESSALEAEPAASSPAAAYFPTLWTDPPSHGHRHRSLLVPSMAGSPPPGLYRNASTSAVAPSPRPPAPRPPARAAHTAASSSGASSSSSSTGRGCIVVDGLSEFDLRKCHPTAAVTKQHGYLQEQDIPQLSAETGYDRTELYALWARFKALCSIAQSPRGIDKDTFRRGLPQLSVEDQFFIDRVFDILDADGSGILEWAEFIEALSALEKGDALKRVLFLFRVYDLNGDGVVQRQDVVQFFLASLLIPATDDVVEHARQFVAKIFEAVGCGDRDGMRVDDAVRYMREHPSADIYSVFGRTMVTTRTKLDVRQWAKGDA
ncbi:hypothetical protein ATCC90586_009742 [Pythium insidiosum]|nr:hypothetical protein ATCC90586_009742 [Pythium insidiosum]